MVDYRMPFGSLGRLVNPADEAQDPVSGVLRLLRRQMGILAAWVDSR
jgi:hypothetical protein